MADIPKFDLEGLGNVFDFLFKVTRAGIVALALIVVLAAVIRAWNAQALVVEPLHVPQSFQQQGLDGTVLAEQLVDRVNGLVKWTSPYALRRGDTVTGNWGEEIDVKIPETGISLLDFERFFRSLFKTERHVTGDLFKHTVWDPGKKAFVSKVAIVLRVDGQLVQNVDPGADPGDPIVGDESQIDNLIGRAGEALLATTQPYRYAILLGNVGRFDEQAGLLQYLADEGAPEERPWAWSKLAEWHMAIGHYARSQAESLAALGVDPGHVPAYSDLALYEFGMGHAENALARARATSRRLSKPLPADIDAQAASVVRTGTTAWLDEMLGNYEDAFDRHRAIQTLTLFWLKTLSPPILVTERAHAHQLSDDGERRGARSLVAPLLATPPDLACVRTVVAPGGAFADIWNTIPAAWRTDAWALHNFGTVGFSPPDFFIAAQSGDWRAAADDLAAASALARLCGNVEVPLHDFAWPWLAYASAKAGDFGSAHRLLAQSGMDGHCYLCILMQGRVEALQGHRQAAERWFDRAATEAPSLPFADSACGEMLLRRGRYGEAIARFAQAARKGPAFADPLELWGEALIAKNRSDLAAIKFAEAARSAPSWGRLHLKWGEALLWSGDGAGAREHFERAAALDLTPSDRAVLARLRGGPTPLKTAQLPPAAAPGAQRPFR